MDEKDLRAAGDALRRQMAADAKTIGGRGAIKRANELRVEWGAARRTKRALRFPAESSGVADPGGQELAIFGAAADVDFLGCCERAARYTRGPIAEFMALGESVKDRRPQKRLPGWLSAARGRMRHEPVDLAEGTIEMLEAMRFDDPRSALKASAAALKEAAGPVAVGRLLAIHASNLREVDQLAAGLLALGLAIPALDVAGDAWGMGRTLTGAAAVVRAFGRFDLARELIDESERWYILAGSVSGRARCIGFRGSLMLASGGDPRVALRELDGALALLEPSQRRLFATYQQIRASGLVELRNLDGARKAAAAALASIPHHARSARGRIAWHAADIEAAAGDHVAAEALYVRAFDLIAEPLCDRLLVAAQAIRAAVRQGEAARAVEMARATLGPMFRSLDDTGPTRRVLRAAHTDLYQAAIDADLSVATVDKAIRQIEAARTSRLRRIRDAIIRPR